MPRRADEYVQPKTIAQRRARARIGLLEIQLQLIDIGGWPFISRADDLILVADDLIDSLDPSFATLDEHGILCVRGSNRTVAYRLIDHSDQEGSWVGVRKGGKADR